MSHPIAPPMSDYETLSGEPVPRSEPLCRRYARRLESPWGFVAYGVLWFFVACGLATLALFAGIALAGDHAGRVAMGLVIAGWVGGFVFAWVLFALWVRSRMRPARRLMREGTFVAGAVTRVDRLSMRGAPFSVVKIAFVHDGRDVIASVSVGGHPTGVAPGAIVPVLYLPGYRYCAAFAVDGQLVAGSV